ncbi:MAG: peroxiredoxin family protein [Planctomycetes bacterium]|nr:peroxiredoxin family protein [Planctomycetota bacterium]
MKHNFIRSLCLACLCISSLLVSAARADDEELGVGKPPPKIQISKFVKGDAPDTGRDEGCVVVAFFVLKEEKNAGMFSALNAAQKEFGAKGLQVVAVSKEKFEDIEKSFSKAERTSMAIAVGADDSENTWRAWIDAAKLDKLPQAFIVSRGKIVWIGSPLDSSLSSILRKAVVGKYDPKLQKKAQPLLDAARKSLKVRNVQEAYKHYDEVIDLDNVFFLDVVLERYKATLKNETDPKIAADWIQKIAKKCGNVTAQGEIVSTIVLDSEIEQRDLESALIIAESMLGKNATAGLEAKAMVFAAKKDWNQAIDLQTDAWMGAPQADKPMAKQRLEEYRAAVKRQSGKTP